MALTRTAHRMLTEIHNKIVFLFASSILQHSKYVFSRSGRRYVHEAGLSAILIGNMPILLSQVAESILVFFSSIVITECFL